MNGNEPGLARRIGLFSAVIVVIANMVGTGIFTTSGFIIEELKDPRAMLLCWVVGGIFALSGALCYGELGAIFPRAGGEYVFLKESFGKSAGFLSGWISLIVGFSAPIAAAAMAFANYGFRTFHIKDTWQLDLFSVAGHDLHFSPSILLAIAVILIFSLVHRRSLDTGKKVQNALTIFKLIVIVAFIAGGFLAGSGSIENFNGELISSRVFSREFAVSLVFITFAYSGWNAAAYLGGEIKRPQRNIPLSLFIGTLLVILLYLLLNAVFIYALPPKEMSGIMEVGTAAAIALFGEKSNPYFSGAVALCLLSVLSVMILTGPRVYYAMGRDRVFFKVFGKVDPASKTPQHAIYLQAAVAVLIVITTSFDLLLLYIGFTLALFSMLTVGGLFIIRFKKPHLKSPYRTWGYPFTPLLFITGNLWIIYFSIISKPVVVLFALATILSGLIVYLVFTLINPALQD
ncbi:MAG: amino acid permease [bacterium]